MKIQESRNFLIAEREEGRRGCMASVDITLAHKEAKAARKKRRQHELQEASTSANIATNTVTLFVSSDSDSASNLESTETCSNNEYEPTQQNALQKSPDTKRKRKKNGRKLLLLNLLLC